MGTYAHTCPECGYEYQTDEEVDQRKQTRETTVRVLLEVPCENDDCDLQTFTDPSLTQIE